MFQYSSHSQPFPEAFLDRMGFRSGRRVCANRGPCKGLAIGSSGCSTEARVRICSEEMYRICDGGCPQSEPSASPQLHNYKITHMLQRCDAYRMYWMGLRRGLRTLLDRVGAFPLGALGWPMRPWFVDSMGQFASPPHKYRGIYALQRCYVLGVYRTRCCQKQF